ncbi:MAG: HAD family hydrolase [Chromatiaceae bacterium]|nr:HAD family hydrolase [Chromatiaceae bacterium]
MSTRFKLLTIDLDDTLWPCAPTIRQAESALYHWLSQAAPRVTAVYDHTGLRRHRQALAAARPEIAHDLTRVRRDALGGLLAGFGYDEALADEAMMVFLDHRNRVEPYAEVVPVLRELGTAYCLVSVTNGNSEVARTPLGGLFHHSLTAALVGARKPDPALFLRALEWGGVAPRQALHLGDDPWLDVEPARRLGMTAVWVNRDGRPWPEDLAPPDAEIGDLTTLRNLLDPSTNAL